MSFFSGKKLLLVGFIVVLLVAIPVTVYLVGQQSRTKSSAAQETTMALVQSPQTVKVGDTVSFDVVVDPANINEVGYVKLVLTYDPTKLATFDGTFTPDQWTSTSGVTFTPDLPQGPPNYGDGTISVDLSVGSAFQNVFKTKTTIATIKFNAIDATAPDISTDVTFGAQTQALSTADQGNVLATLPPPGKVFITGTGTTSGCNGGSDFNWSTNAFSLDAKGVCLLIGDTQFLVNMDSSVLKTDPRNLTSDGFYNSNIDFQWSENGVQMRINLLIKYTDQGTWKLSTARTYDGTDDGKWIYYNTSDQAGHPIASGTANNYTGSNIDLSSNSQSEVQTTAKLHMDSLTLTNLVAFLKTLSPLATTISPTTVPTTVSPTTAANGLSCTSLSLDPGATGTAPFAINLTAAGKSGSANITKVTFNYGDGQTQDVTDAGGIGTTSISVLASHTYATSGTFNATAVLTDENGLVSSGGCTATITVTDQAGASPTVVSPSPLPPTGPTGLVTIGAIGVMLTFIGAILLLAL